MSPSSSSSTATETSARAVTTDVYATCCHACGALCLRDLDLTQHFCSTCGVEIFYANLPPAHRLLNNQDTDRSVETVSDTPSVSDVDLTKAQDDETHASPNEDEEMYGPLNESEATHGSSEENEETNGRPDEDEELTDYSSSYSPSLPSSGDADSSYSPHEEDEPLPVYSNCCSSCGNVCIRDFDLTQHFCLTCGNEVFYGEAVILPVSDLDLGDALSQYDDSDSDSEEDDDADTSDLPSKREYIASLERQVISEPKQDDNGSDVTECVICYHDVTFGWSGEDTNGGEDHRAVQVHSDDEIGSRHSYLGLSCARRWFEHSNSCPLCRSRMFV